MAPVNRLPYGVLLQVLLRSFLLQASWNFERMQSLGLLFILHPALGRLYREEDLKLACSRHLEYFNTHPFMASPIIGAVLALEQGRARGEDSPLGVQEFKRMIMAPYAAVGDALFWGGLRPLAAGVALFFAARGSLLAPAVLLAVFNIPHFWMRGAGLLRGYVLGIRVVEVLQRRRLPDLALRAKEAAVVLLGGLSAYIVFLGLRGEEVALGWGAATVPLVLLLAWLARKGVSSLLLVLSVALVILLAAGFGNV